MDYGAECAVSNYGRIGKRQNFINPINPKYYVYKSCRKKRVADVGYCAIQKLTRASQAIINLQLVNYCRLKILIIFIKYQLNLLNTLNDQIN